MFVIDFVILGVCCILLVAVYFWVLRESNCVVKYYEDIDAKSIGENDEK